MNNLRRMMMLYRMGKKSQQMMQVLTKNRYSKTQTILSVIGVAQAAIAIAKKMGWSMKKPGNQQQKSNILQAALPQAEFSKELTEVLTEKNK